MADISLGAVGAAIIAGLISLLSLVITKEQKVSDFRQAWIEDLRKCLVTYLVNMNSVSDILKLEKAGKISDVNLLLNQYKLLNEASYGIKFRVNPKEEKSIILLKIMEEFEEISGDNSSLTSGKIKQAEEKFSSAAKDLLKFEWTRVKKGERTYIITKRFAISMIILLFIALVVLFASGKKSNSDENANPYFHRSVFLERIQLRSSSV